MISELDTKIYSIIEKSPEVKERIIKSLFQRAMINLNIVDSEESDSAGEPAREIELRINEAHQILENGIRGSGRTSDNFRISVEVPEDETETSRLTVYKAIISQLFAER